MLPLSDVRVVEFCQILAGPFCGSLLADMGANVIKVEPPQGDPMRQWAPMLGDYSQYFATLNRNKRSVALDLKDENDRAAARTLALSADIVIENFRPGVLTRYGLDYATLKEDSPALVYCSISAFGQVGPRATEGGFDVTLQAMSGVMSVTGEADGAPNKCGLPIADTTAGLYAAYSAAAALYRAKLSGTGEYIDISMLGGMLGIAHLQTSEFFATGRDPVRRGSAHPMNAPYAAFRSRDGDFVIAAGTNALWAATCEVIGRTELVDDPRFASPALRGQNQKVLTEIIEAEFLKLDTDQLLTQLNRRGVPCSPINSYSQILADPQVTHLDLVAGMPLANGKSARVIVSPQRLSGKALGIYRSSPALGEHNAEVLAECALPNQKVGASRFREFVSGFARLIERTTDEAEILHEGERLLAGLVREDDWLPDSSACSHPDRYQQHLLYCDPLCRYAVVSFVWGPGQRTPVHDHTVWGLIGMLRGAEISRPYKSRPGEGMVAGEEIRLEAGQVEKVSPAVGDIHEVWNAYSDRISISIHVYGANIGIVRRHIYEPETGMMKPFTSGYSGAMLPNFWTV